MLVRLIYYSEVGEIQSVADVKDIVTVATRNNFTNGITGCLYFDEKYFVQILEGDRAAISATYHRILADRRHKKAVLVDVSPLACRDFANWSVLYLGKLKPKAETLLKFSPTREFNPQHMTTENLVEFVMELKNENA